VTRDLVEVVMGRRPADLVIRDGRWVNVCSGEIIDHTDIAILGSRIAYCGPDVRSMIGESTKVIEADGRYLIPGLLDAHVHVESSMLTISQFARAVLPHGTTGAFIDPHEIANVLGLAGVQLMADEAWTTPMKIYLQVPSCVPAAPGLETTGASIGPQEVAEAMRLPGVIGLGEVMNYPGVAAGDKQLHAEISEAMKAGGIIGGHYASPDLGPTFHAYAAAGPSDCHEGTRVEDTIARVRQGMVAMLRQGSAWHDLAAQLPAITKRGIDSRHVVLCTDDRHPGTLLTDGHMNDVVRLAISEGAPPMTAIRMATLNTAEHFGVAQDVGCIAPARFADILIVSDFERLAIDLVIAGGQIAAESGKQVSDFVSYTYPREALESVHLARSLAASDFDIPASVEERTIACRVIEVIENQVLTRAVYAELPVERGRVLPDSEQDIALLSVVERHHASGRIGLGLVKGFGVKGCCALASTVAHDSHNLLIIGTDTAAMAKVGNHVAQMGGGVCLVKDNQILASIPLPIAGLMSDQPLETVAEQAETLHDALRSCGCSLNNAFMPFSFLALPVIPELRLTDLGLVDVAAQSLVTLFP
jgi:adenine deaminase